MRHLCFKRNSGLTLVEAMVTTVIFMFIFGAAFRIMISGSDIYEINNTRTQLQQELRKAKTWMNEDIRQGGSASVVNVFADDSWYTSLEYRKAAGVTGGAITWDTDTTVFFLDTVNRQVKRTTGSVTKIIANDIEALEFRRMAAAPDIVEVMVEAENTTPKGRVVNETTNFQIQLRN